MTNDFYITSYRFFFRIEKDCFLPVFMGDVYRSMLGKALRETVCIKEGVRCEECPERSCLCILLFQQDKRNKKGSKPFVLSSFPTVEKFLPSGGEIEYLKGDHIGFDITFLGKGNDLAPFFFVALNSVRSIKYKNIITPINLSEIHAVDLKGGGMKKIESLPGDHHFPLSFQIPL